MLERCITNPWHSPIKYAVEIQQEYSRKKVSFLLYVLFKFSVLKLIYPPCIYGVYLLIFLKQIYRHYRWNFRDTGKFNQLKILPE